MMKQRKPSNRVRHLPAALAPMTLVPMALALLALGGAAVGLASAPAAAQAGEGFVCTTQEFNAFLTTLKPVEGRITLAVSPNKKVWKIGEQTSFTVTSPVAGELLLMSIDKEGVVFPIFPNAHQAAGSGAKIAAKQALTLPQPDQGFAFQTEGPPGPSRLIAIVRPEGRQLTLPCARPLTKGLPVTVGAGDASAKAPPPVPKVFEGWGYAAFDYTVVEGE
jgi:hypothetical protein